MDKKRISDHRRERDAAIDMVDLRTQEKLEKERVRRRQGLGTGKTDHGFSQGDDNLNALDAAIRKRNDERTLRSLGLERKVRHSHHEINGHTPRLGDKDAMAMVELKALVDAATADKHRTAADAKELNDVMIGKVEDLEVSLEDKDQEILKWQTEAVKQKELLKRAKD
jgi:hypothetical protein